MANTTATPESEFSSLSHAGNETRVYFTPDAIKYLILLLCPFVNVDRTSGKSQHLEA